MNSYHAVGIPEDDVGEVEKMVAEGWTLIATVVDISIIPPLPVYVFSRGRGDEQTRKTVVPGGES